MINRSDSYTIVQLASTPVARHSPASGRISGVEVTVAVGVGVGVGGIDAAVEVGSGTGVCVGSRVNVALGLAVSVAIGGGRVAILSIHQTRS